MKKICILSRYGSWHEESYLRFFQFIPKFNRLNISTEVLSLYPEDVKKNVFLFNEPGTGRMIPYLKRTYQLLFQNNYSHLWIDGESLPGILFHLESYILPLDKKVILDLGDSIFYKYEKSQKLLDRFLLRDKIPGLIQRADMVICRNSSIYEYATRFKSENIYLFHPSLNLKHFTPVSRIEEDGVREFILGFIGSHYSSNFLGKIQNVIRELGRYYPLRVIVMNGNENLEFPVKHTHLSVTQETEKNELSHIDAGIFPFPNSLKEKGNLNIDILKMMAMAIPVVATDLGAASDYIQNGVNGYLCKTDDDWYINLRLLLDEKDLAKNLGENARKTIEERFDSERIFNKLLPIFD